MYCKSVRSGSMEIQTERQLFFQKSFFGHNFRFVLFATFCYQYLGSFFIFAKSNQKKVSKNGQVSKNKPSSVIKVIV